MKSFSLTQILLSSSQNKMLTGYTPSPHDGKFATGLLLALKHNAPLTGLQKAFLYTIVIIPGPISWKLAFFEWLNNLSASHFSFPGFILIIILILIGIYLLKRYLLNRLSKKEPLTYLELVFPARTDKTPYATKQLFTHLHSLARQNRGVYKLLRYKKRYAFEITASKEEGIRYILGISKKEAPIIEKSLLSFMPGLKVTKVKDYISNDIAGKKSQTKEGVTELKLASDFALPLEEQGSLKEHDQIAYLTGQMTKLKDGELMVFQIVVTPVKKSTHKGVLKRIRKLNVSMLRNEPLSGELFKTPFEKALATPLAIAKALLLALAWFIKIPLKMATYILNDGPTDLYVINKPHSNENVANPIEQELRDKVKGKTDQPMFETSIRMFAKTDSSADYDLRTSGFLASLHGLSNAHQSLLKKLSLPLFNQWTLSNLAGRRLAAFSNPILSVSELAGLYHFPHSLARTEDLVKAKSSELSAPLSFKKSATKFDNVFAKNTYGGTETPIGQTLEERRRHTYILGATGSGKTTLLANMILNDIKAGKGVGVIDPHGQLVEEILKAIPKERAKDVIWFAPDDDAYPIALNLLELPKDKEQTLSQLQKQKSLVTSSIISIIQKFYDAKFFGPRMEYVLRNTILTALETKDPTLKTVLDLLTKTRYRKEIVKNLDNEVLKDYWTYEFEKLGALQRNSVISPITNKIGGLLASPINYNILTQVHSKLDFEEAMDSGKILLCDLSKGKIGEDESSFFGSLVIAKIQLAALKRARTSEEKRKDFFLYVDEFQNFATNTFAELVSEARKYRLSVVMAHQSVSQIENRDIVKVILANVGTVICFRTANPEDEQFILPIFSPEVSKYEIANLPLYRFYMKVAVGKAEDSFLAGSYDFKVKADPKTAQAVIRESRKRYAAKINQIKEKKAVQQEVKEIKSIVSKGNPELGELTEKDEEELLPK